MSIRKATQNNRSTAIHQNNNRELQKNCLIPMEISRKEATAMGLDPAEIRPVKIGNRLVDGMLIPASSEEQYRGIIRDIWKEEQRLARSRKCSVSNGHGGLKRCEDDCSKCTRMKTGSALSLDYLKDENGLEASEPVVDVCGTVLTAVLFQDLMDNLILSWQKSLSFCMMVNPSALSQNYRSQVSKQCRKQSRTYAPYFAAACHP